MAGSLGLLGLRGARKVGPGPAPELMPLRPKAELGIQGQILELQSTAGNVAVQRLLGASSGAPAHVQRMLTFGSGP